MIHLHCHTTYSFLDGTISPEKLVEETKNREMSAVAITDHGSMSGAIKFYKAAQEHGVKPIIGIEAYFVDDVEIKEKGEKKYHIVLLAKSEKGFYSLLKLMSEAHRNLYYKPRIDLDILEEKGEDLVILTACAGGILSHPNYDRLVKRISQSFPTYLEIMPIDAEAQELVNSRAVELSERFDLPLVATNDVHYLNKDDEKYHNFLLKMTKNFQFDVGGLYLRTRDEMEEAFDDIDVDRDIYETALDNTKLVADGIDIELTPKPMTLPKVVEGDPHKELVRLVKERHGRVKKWTKKHTKRIKYELSVIKEKGFSDYLLLVTDFVDEAVRRGFQLGYGRGSAAGSLLCYVLGITGIDPLEHGLIFERFLNPARSDYPDIDCDFQQSRRDELIEYGREKFGRDRVTQISTFNVLRPKSALKEVMSYHKVPFFEANKITSLIDNDQTIMDCIIEDTELASLIRKNNITDEMIAQAQFMVGTFRHESSHAAGIVICPGPVENYGIVERRKKEEVINWDKNDIEFFGIIKVDFLGLSALDKFGETLGLVGTVDWNNVDYEKVWDAFSLGHTAGIFQFESDNVTQFLLKLKWVDDKNTLIDVNALVRPGPFDSGQADLYVKRYLEEESEKKPYEEEISSIVGDTYGVIVYQEQVIRILTDLAGYSIPEADNIRKLIAKSKGAEEIEKHRSEFVEGLEAHSGLSDNVANPLWDDICAFGRYSFNKSHAASYTELAVNQMWLKVHYPAEFMLGQLKWTEKEEKRKKLTYECKKLGIELGVPDINLSNEDYTLAGEKIMIGLDAIKGVGPVAVKHILDQRGGGFEDIEDFRVRTEKRKANSAVITALTKAGCFDSFGVNHRRVEEYKDLLSDLYDHCAGRKKKFNPDDLDILYDVEGDYTEEEKMLNMSSLLGGAYQIDMEPEVGLNIDNGRLDKVSNLIDRCKKCDLWLFASSPVPFDYTECSEIMIIGEAPGREEVDKDKPFVGDAGKKLFGKLAHYGIKRKHCFISNVFKCRPSNNRLPENPPKECYMFLKKEIEILQPKLIVALGNRAREFFTGQKSGIIASNAKVIVENVCGKPIPVLYSLHPASILHNRVENGPLFDEAMKKLYEVKNGKRC